ncbi:hypothetical protein PHMEG_00038314 [Phytophthora megakarya]|uniref:Uncharacterized protein n=1 Tax=Phytophthora megakarya TaxID=4795 RepID=A0A225UI10_9STRA|nr:hypothetical protein PHMEG_00038314 [Phytophthora megakarya]
MGCRLRPPSELLRILSVQEHAVTSKQRKRRATTGMSRKWQQDIQLMELRRLKRRNRADQYIFEFELRSVRRIR